MANIRLGYTNRLEDVATTPAQKLLNANPINYVSILNCGSGATTITRASGSFVADGVKIGMQIQGTHAARWPANTRVGTVAALTLTMNGAVSLSAGTNESGSFAASKVLNEDANYPTVNLMNKQRYIPWKTTSASDGVIFDLGSNKSVGLIALLGHAYDPALGGLDQADVYSSPTSYPSAGSAGAWTSRGSITMSGLRDGAAAIVLSPTVSARFWAFDFLATDRFTLGSIFLGLVDQDLGMQFGPGSDHSIQQPNSVLYTATGLPYEFMSPFDIRRWSMRWEALTETNRAKLQAVLKASRDTRTPVLVDESDKAWEVRFRDRQFAWATKFYNIVSTSLELESLP